MPDAPFITSPSKPDDLPSAHRLIGELQETLQKQQREIAQLRHKLDELCRRLYGRSSEQVSAAQLKLAFEQLGQEPPAQPAPEEPVEMDSGESLHPGRRRRPKGRQKLPESLPRRREVVDLPEAERVCACGETKRCIGEAVAEKLDYVPASFSVVETVTLKYACPRCHEGVTTGKAPAQAVEKGLATEGLLAHVVVSKYADHLPLHRLESIFVRQDVPISRRTMCDWVAQVAEALEPIGQRLREEVLATDYLQTDDTPVTVLDENRGSIKGRLWVYLDPLGKQVVFDATASRERAGPEGFLSGFRGHLQADAYKGYDALYARGGVTEVACWAHARRYFVEAMESDPQAAFVLAQIRLLYEVEDKAKDLDPEARRQLRLAESVPRLAALDRTRRELAAVVLPKSPLGEALSYLDNQWQALQRFVDDGRLRIDNNGAERQLRIVAVGRNNWLFAGSMAGAERTALMYSLVQSCRLAGAEPFAYFRDVLLRVATHPQARIGELTPKGWVAACQAQQ